MKTETEIENMADRAAAAASDPQFSGMTYEEGVRTALDWVLGNLDEGETPLD